MFNASMRLNVARAIRQAHFEVLGEELSAKHGYGLDGDGLEAIYYHLAKKFGWTPNECRALSQDDLALALSEELNGWTLPKPLRGLSKAIEKALESPKE